LASRRRIAASNSALVWVAAVGASAMPPVYRAGIVS
jgi:hypothetical protein